MVTSIFFHLHSSTVEPTESPGGQTEESWSNGLQLKFALLWSLCYFTFFFPNWGLRNSKSLRSEIMKNTADNISGFECILPVKKPKTMNNYRHYWPLVEFMWTNGSQALLVDLQIWDKNTISTERAPISACNYLVIIWLSLRMHMVDQVYTYLPSHRRGKYDEVNWSATTASSRSKYLPVSTIDW